MGPCETFLTAARVHPVASFRLDHPRSRLRVFRRDVKSPLIALWRPPLSQLSYGAISYKAAGSIKTFAVFVIRLVTLSVANCCFFKLIRPKIIKAPVGAFVLLCFCAFGAMVSMASSFAWRVFVGSILERAVPGGSRLCARAEISHGLGW